ncbi:hypothetical protein [Nostoc sp. TCL240-02]|nr:hypothetical protein [Nostoc sp. TCL240-02]
MQREREAASRQGDKPATATLRDAPRTLTASMGSLYDQTWR